MKNIWIVFSLMCFFSCTSTPEVKTQQYATLKNQRDFTHSLPEVWGGIETSLRNHKIIKRKPSEVSPVEFKKLSKRELETDWIYGRSENKYIEYKLNDLPKKQYLNTRHKFIIVASTKIGGTNVEIETIEEVEEVDKKGSSKGYSSSYAPDSRKAHQLLETIRVAIYSSI
jgi:hypothetical protein